MGKPPSNKPKAGRPLKPAKNHSPLISRRGMIAATLATGAALFGGKSAWDYVQEHEPCGEYSLEDGVQLYMSLKRSIEEKFNQAQKEKKPFRIFMLENHENMDALAYELMIVDIAKQLGIDTVLWELDKQQFNALPTTSIDIVKATSLEAKEQAWSSMVFDFATKKRGCTVIPIDTKYASLEQYVQDVLLRTTQRANEILKEQFGLEIPLQVSVDNSMHMQVAFQYKLPLEPARKAQFNEMMNAAYQKILSNSLKERSEFMLSAVKDGRYSGAGVLCGKHHGVDMIPPMRKAGDAIDVTFSLPENPRDNSIVLTAEAKATAEWVADPKNAIQCVANKHFDLANLPGFVERVSRKVNGKNRAAER